MPQSKLSKVYFLAHIIVFLIIASFIFFATPTADDYAYALKSLKFTPFEDVKNEYMKWAARYTQVFITSVRYDIFPLTPTSYPFWLGFYIILMFCSIYYFCSSLFKSILSKRGITISAFIIITGIIANLPTLDESIFWEITSITYILPVCGLLTLFTFIFNNYNKLNNPKTIIMYFILSLVLSGLNQIVFIELFLFAIGLTLYKIFDKEFKLIYLVYIIIPIIAGLIIILCPGRLKRMDIFPNSGQLFYTIKWTLWYGTVAIMQSLINPYIWASILLFHNILQKLYASYSKTSKYKYKVFIYSIFYFGMLYAIEFVHIYGIGKKPVNRLMTIWYILFYIGLIPLATILSPFISRTYECISIKYSKLSRINLKLNSILFLIIIISLLGINNFPKAIYDLSINIPRYIEDKNRMYSDIKLQQNTPNPGNILILHDFKHDPLLLKTPTGADYGLSSFFGFTGLKLLPPKE